MRREIKLSEYLAPDSNILSTASKYLRSAYVLCNGAESQGTAAVAPTLPKGRYINWQMECVMVVEESLGGQNTHTAGGMDQSFLDEVTYK